MTIGNQLVFWTLAILPGLLHPFLLCVYSMRFNDRKELITLLLKRSAAAKEEWKDRLDLDLLSYILPVIIASLMSISGAAVILAMNLKPGELPLPDAWQPYTKLATPAAVAGFAGAYIWGIYDFVDRLRILSFPSSAMHLIWFRLLLYPVLGAYAQTLMAREFAPVLVFALASFPVSSVFTWLQDAAAQRLAISRQGAVVSPKWELVQGLTPDIVARLSEIGVSSVAHLANQDPISLLKRTNIEWRNILDMLDQAYLAVYVGEDIEKLRAKGIRGAIEAAVIGERLKGKDRDTLAVLKSIASDLGKDEADIRNLVRNLWEDAQVERIRALWNRPD